MSEYFDVVYEDRKVTAPADFSRGFSMFDVQSLDAPVFIPAGSTEGRSNFHVTRFAIRIGG